MSLSQCALSSAHSESFHFCYSSTFTKKHSLECFSKGAEEGCWWGGMGGFEQSPKALKPLAASVLGAWEVGITTHGPRASTEEGPYILDFPRDFSALSSSTVWTFHLLLWQGKCLYFPHGTKMYLSPKQSWTWAEHVCLWFRSYRLDTGCRPSSLLVVSRRPWFRCPWGCALSPWSLRAPVLRPWTLQENRHPVLFSAHDCLDQPTFS